MEGWDGSLIVFKSFCVVFGGATNSQVCGGGLAEGFLYVHK